MRVATAHYWRRLPHELGSLPLTYFQTLYDAVVEASKPLTRNGGEDENEDVLSVDVDELIRKGQRTGFGDHE